MTKRATSSGSTLRARALSKIPKAKEEKRVYFAYGSNLLLKQMRDRCPGYKLRGTAVLYNYRVVCNKVKSDGINYCAGLKKSTGNKVLGALYKLTPSDIKALDVDEGCYAGTVHYYRDEKDFYVKNRETGEPVNAFTYFVARPVTPKKPTLEYWEKIFQGCRDHNFPEEYVKNLRKWFLMEPDKLQKRHR